MSKETKQQGLSYEEENNSENYYLKILSELENAPDDTRVPVERLFLICQEYWWVHLKCEHIKKVKSVLQNYKIVLNTNRQRKESMSILHKLNIEYFSKIYMKHYKTNEKDFVREMVINYDDEKMDRIWAEIFEGDTKETSKNDVKDAILEWTDYDNVYSMKSLSLEKLHEAMKVLGESIDMPKPTIEESVLEVLSTDVLELILDEVTYNLPTLILTAPVRIALTVGETKSNNSRKKPKKGITITYFSKPFEKNLEALKKDFDDYSQIYLEDYVVIQNELQEEFKDYL